MDVREGLQQQFGDAAGSGGVAVNGEDVLHRTGNAAARESHHVDVGVFAQQAKQVSVGGVAILQAGEEVNQISAAPLDMVS